MALFPGAWYMFNQGRQAVKLLLLAMVIGIPGAENPDAQFAQGAESGQGNNGQVEKSDNPEKSGSKSRDGVKQAENPAGKELENPEEIETGGHDSNEVGKLERDSAGKSKVEQTEEIDADQVDITGDKDGLDGNGEEWYKVEHPEGIVGSKPDNHEGIVSSKLDNHEGIVGSKPDNHEGIVGSKPDYHEGIVGSKPDNHEGIVGSKPEHHEGSSAKSNGCSGEGMQANHIDNGTRSDTNESKGCSGGGGQANHIDNGTRSDTNESNGCSGGGGQGNHIDNGTRADTNAENGGANGKVNGAGTDEESEAGKIKGSESKTDVGYNEGIGLALFNYLWSSFTSKTVLKKDKKENGKEEIELEHPGEVETGSHDGNEEEKLERDATEKHTVEQTEEIDADQVDNTEGHKDGLNGNKEEGHEIEDSEGSSAKSAQIGRQTVNQPDDEACIGSESREKIVKRKLDGVNVRNGEGNLEKIEFNVCSEGGVHGNHIDNGTRADTNESNGCSGEGGQANNIDNGTRADSNESNGCSGEGGQENHIDNGTRADTNESNGCSGEGGQENHIDNGTRADTNESNGCSGEGGQENHIDNGTRADTNESNGCSGEGGQGNHIENGTRADANESNGCSGEGVQANHIDNGTRADTNAENGGTNGKVNGAGTDEESEAGKIKGSESKTEVGNNEGIQGLLTYLCYLWSFAPTTVPGEDKENGKESFAEIETDVEDFLDLYTNFEIVNHGAYEEWEVVNAADLVKKSEADKKKPEADKVSGGTEADKVSGGTEADKVSGGTEADKVSGGTEADKVSGGTAANNGTEQNSSDILKNFVVTGPDGVEKEPGSLEHLHRTELFPQKVLVRDEDSLKVQVPFPPLRGEWPEFLGRTADGIIVISNFRLLVRNKESFINIPLGLIESLETRDIFYLHVYCKDATVIRCAFSTNQACVDWYNRIASKTKPAVKLADVFALWHHAWCTDTLDVDPSDSCLELCNPPEKVESYSFTKELERLKFDTKTAWRLTEVNDTFKVCASYPTEHIMPRSISDDVLKEVAKFRGLHRFPSIVWRNRSNGAVLARSGQPEIGLFGWRKEEDENMLNAIPLACALNPGTENSRQTPRDDGSSSDSSPEDSAAESQDDNVQEAKTLQIADCRSFGAAFANRAKGGGMECTEYYRSCEIEFMNLVNIHAVRKSFMALREACKSHQDQASWLSTLDNTRWLHNIASLLKAAVYVVVKMDKEGRPVLVHCSDGWDRTSQLTSLAELLMDPYYRTAEGFKILVEREWIYFGHKFSDRCGNGLTTEPESERSPVFVQWLECVYQIHRQFPCQFEFNEAFLIKLVHHTYSNLFGTFLCNNIKQRKEHNLDLCTAPVWNLLNKPKFANLLYDATAEPQVLYPATNVQNLQLWTSVYLSKNSSFAGVEDPIPLAESESPGLPKTRSCDNLCQNEVNSSPDRRRSDPNIATDHGEQQTQKLLKDAMSGDNSCSTESVKSSENNTVVNESTENTEDTGSSVTNRSDCGDAAVGKDDTESLHDNDVEQNGDVEKHDGKDGEESNVIVAEEGDRKDGEESNVIVAEESDRKDGEESNVIVAEEGETGEGVVKDVSEVPKEGSETNGIEKKVEEVDVDVNKIDNSNVNENRATNSADAAVGMTENGASENKLNLSNGVHEMNEPSDAGNMTENPDSATDESAGNSIETISESEDTSDCTEDDKVQNGAEEDKIKNGAEEDKVKNGAEKDNEVVQNGKSTSEAQEVDTPGNPAESEQQNGRSEPVELDILEKVAAIKHQQRAILVNKSTLSMESSTDTVTEGDGNQTPTPSPRSKSSSQPSPNGCGHQCINASSTSLCDKSESVANGNQDANLELANSISTSTSDLTDSRVLGVKNGIARDHLLNGADTSLKLHMSLLGQNGRNGASRGMTVDTSLLPVVPNSPQSRTSTCPPTPGTSGSEGKSLESTIPRHQAIQRHLDADGLTIFNDPIQNQILSIERKYQQDVSSLRAEVAQLRGMLAQQPHFSNGDMGFGDEDRPHGRVSPPGGSDVHSINSVTSNPASDASWDPMDDPEVHLTRWVPSFTVSNCASCGTAFGLFYRKHHCRNCGWVFCHNCCKDTIPLPHQMLHTSERVCRECYNKIMFRLDRSIMEFDSAISLPN